MTAPVIVPGDDRSPVLLHVPHAGTEIPAWVRDRLLLDDAQLAAEQAALTDHRTDELAAAAAAAARVRPFLLVNPVSRFVVDVERFPDEREEMAAVGMAAVYTHGTRGQRIRAADPEHHAALLATHYEPWAAAVHDAVAGRLAATGRAVLLDVHSYPSAALPYELHGAAPRPPVCLGTDPFHTPPELVAAARAAFGDRVALDVPFSGVYVPLAHLHREPRLTALMIEIRRDGYLAEPAGPPTDGFGVLADAITRLIDEVTALTPLVDRGTAG